MERMIRDSRPPGVGRNEPLSDRARADLIAIMAEPTPQQRRRASGFTLPAWSAVVTAATAALAVIVLVTTNVLTPAPSYAATPPLLSVQSVHDDASRTLRDLAATLRTAAGVDVPVPRTETIRVQTWGLVTNPDGDQPTWVSPENHEITRHADDAFDQVVTAGQPFDAAGEPIDEPNLPAYGAELWSNHEKSGEHAYVFPSVLPATAGELRALISDLTGLTDRSPAGDWMPWVTALLMERDPTASEEAVVLDLLADLDLELAGTTTDRLGRDALVFETPTSDAGFVERLLISPAGRILASETLYTGNDRTDIPSPAVVSYFAWERN